jgi:hypothetical protein
MNKLYLYLPKFLRRYVSYDTRMAVEGLCDVDVDGINHRDCPDYCDAFIADAYWSKTGDRLNEAEIETVNNDSSLVYEYVLERIY